MKLQLNMQCDPRLSVRSCRCDLMFGCRVHASKKNYTVKGALSKGVPSLFAAGPIRSPDQIGQ